MNVGISFFVVHRISYTHLEALRMIGFPFWMSIILVCYQGCKLPQNVVGEKVIYLRATYYFWAKPEDVENVIIHVL
jgi:hypothetical protein